MLLHSDHHQPTTILFNNTTYIAGNNVSFQQVHGIHICNTSICNCDCILENNPRCHII